jgi:hypothetical protein
VVSSTVRSPRFRHKNPTSVPPPTTPASTHCLSHATPQAQGPSLLELSGFAFRLQARRSPWPNRVRHPADCWLTSRCSPPCLAATQLRSISRAGERLPGGDSNPFVSVPSRAHKRPSSCSAGRSRPARRTADVERGAGARSEERGARRTTDRAAHRRDRDALASRPTGRSAASRKGRGRAAVGGTACQASRLDSHLSPARCARHPASTRTSLEAAELLLGRAVTPGEAHRRRGARSEERGGRRIGQRTAAIATLSRPGRPGGRPLRGRAVDGRQWAARRARHPASTRTSLRHGVPGIPPRRAPLSKRPSSCSAGRSRPAKRTADVERGARSEERGARSEEDDGSGSAPPRSRRSRVPADREVGRFEEGPWTGGSGRHGVPGIPPRLAPLSGTLCQASRLDAHLSRSGRAPARPGGHARRERTAGVEREARSEKTRNEERGGRRIGQRTAAIATLSRPGRPGGRPLRGRAVDGRQWAARCARHPASTRTSLEAAELLLGRAVTPGESAPQAWSVKRGARRRGTRSEEDDGSGSAPPRSRRSRVPADREVGRFEEGPWTGGSGRHGVPGIPPRLAPLSGTVCQASRLDAHLSRSGRAPARPGGHARRSAPQAWSVKRGARRRGTRSEEDDGSGSAPPRSRRSRVPADREVGRFEEGPWTGGSGRHGVPGIPPRRAPLSGTVCQAPASTRTSLEAAELLLGRAVTPGESAPQTWSEERGARSEERGGRRIGQRTAAIATLSRPGRPGGRPLRGRAVDGRQWAARRARHPASTRTSLRHGVPGIPPRRAPLSKRPSSCSAGRSRPARAHRRRGARSEERGARSEEDDGSGSAPPRSRRSRVPADREVGRFEEGPWTGGSGRHGVPGIPPRRAPLSGTVCQASRLDAHLSRSGRAPARPGGHARRSAPQTWSEEQERGARSEERGGRRIGQRTAAIATLSRPGRPGGRPLRGRAVDGRQWAARCARHPASTRTSLRHGVPGIPPRRAPLSGTVCQASRLDAHLSRSGRAPARPGGHARRSAPQTWSEERGARRTTDRAAHRRDRDALASRPTGRSAASRKGPGTGGSGRHGVPGIPPRRAPLSKRPSSCSAGRSRPARAHRRRGA